ncbi:MAG: ATP-dependent metallopeptidase FtsH/Yme1/Tma family protein, partial [Crocinitomicaceae bacterium]
MANETPNNNKNTGKKSFNFYWIYALIAVGIIAVQLFSNSSVSREITPNDFFDIAQKGYVEKIDIINNQEVSVFIYDNKIDALKKLDSKYDKITKSKTQFGESAQLTFNSPDQKFFLENVKSINDTLKAQGKPEINYKLVNQVNWMSILLNISLPLILIFGLYFLFMRRMGGGGGGGQIFNIGKSK